MIVNSTISVIVPAYNAANDIPKLLDSISKQTFQNFEIIVVDDSSTDETVKIARAYNCRVIENNRNRGPSFCRNLGAKASEGDILVFTDSDCEPELNWIEQISNAFSNPGIQAIMGKVYIKPSNFIGDSVSALGFPAGGSIGFDKIWKVDSNFFTDSLSSCNCAILRKCFWEVGGFDLSFPYAGGEDSYLAYNLRSRGYRIKYIPEIVIAHAARDKLIDFTKWQFKRGMSSYIFSKKVSNRKKFVGLRFWSTRNIIRNFISDRKFPFILILLTSSFLLQIGGYMYMRRKGLKE